MTASLAVHSFNEADALRRLILSSLHATPAFDEWVVLDHRSDDHTQAVLDELEPILRAYGVRLTRLHESRDLSRELTFAHVRARTIHAARNKVVSLMDADFILGHKYASVLQKATTELERHDSRYATWKFPIPCVWDTLRTDGEGRITRHGRVFRHQYSHRIMRRDSVTYEQDSKDGRWERLSMTTRHRTLIHRVRNDGNILVSANVKPPDRLDLRATMTFFMEDTMTGRVDGTWLEQYEAGSLRRMPEYPYDASANLRGVRLNLSRLNL